MKGIFYSIMMALFVVPILALIIFYSQSGAQNIDTNIRANELEYFTESLQDDLIRFLQIDGKRALIAAVSEVVTSGVGLDDAQLRITEMIENGTLYGSPAPLVNEKNLIIWKQNVTDIANKSGFNLNFKDISINISQYDSYNVLFNVTISINISDENAKMGVLKNITTPVAVSLENIEDPIFPLKTYGRVFRFIRVSNVSKTTVPIIGQNSSGGSVSGNAFVKLNSQLQPGSYSGKILITDTISGKESIADDFDGVVTEVSTIPPSFPKPIITGISNAVTIIKNETRLYLDQNTKGVWDLRNLTIDIKNVNSSYYHYYHNSSAGASFLDRLEGRTTLSAKYIYGLETFVNLEELPTELVKGSTSVLDYKYWNNEAGSFIRNGNYDSIFSWFKIDYASAANYGIQSLL